MHDLAAQEAASAAALSSAAWAVTTNAAGCRTLPAAAAVPATAPDNVDHHVDSNTSKAQRRADDQPAQPQPQPAETAAQPDDDYHTCDTCQEICAHVGQTVHRLFGHILRRQCSISLEGYTYDVIAICSACRGRADAIIEFGLFVTGPGQ